MILDLNHDPGPLTMRLAKLGAPRVLPSGPVDPARQFSQGSGGNLNQVALLLGDGASEAVLCSGQNSVRKYYSRSTALDPSSQASTLSYFIPDLGSLPARWRPRPVPRPLVQFLVGRPLALLQHFQPTPLLPLVPMVWGFLSPVSWWSPRLV